MIRGDNACAWLSYCFNPFANSEEASLNSRSGGSLSKLRAELLSLPQNKTLTSGKEWVNSPNQIHPQRITDHPVLAPGAEQTSLTKADCTVSVESFHCTWAPQLCFHFLWVNTRSVHLILNDTFPLHLNGTAQSSSCYLRLFHTLLESPYTEAPFCTFPIYLF